MKIHRDGISGFFSGFLPSAWEEGGLEAGLCVPRAPGSRPLGGNRAGYRRDLSRPSRPVGRRGLEFPESPARTTRTFDLDRIRACGRSPTQRPHLDLPPGLGHSRWQDTHPFSKDHMEPRDPLAPSRGPGHRETQLLISSTAASSALSLPWVFPLLQNESRVPSGLRRSVSTSPAYRGSGSPTPQGGPGRP